MDLLKGVMFSLVTGMLVGCASPAQDAPDQWYVTMALNETMTTLCHQAGLMDSDTSATGMYLVRMYKQQTYHDPAKLNFRINEAKSALNPVQEADCARYTVFIKTTQMEQESKQARQLSNPAQLSTPRQTNCSTYFGQTHCTSY
ncbi:MAG: hypothetical protein E2594_17155 [Pseudomonas sp.]|nr:hypothetical protein [Pseudomonas sp.]